MKQSLRVQALRVLVALLIAFKVTGAALASDNGKLEGYIGAVKAALPQGWSVQSSQSGTTPPDWYTHDERAGVLLNVGNTKSSAKIWTLPADWIGIRKVPNDAPRFTYWEGVLGGRNYKLIMTGGDYGFHRKFYDNMFHAGISTPSLVNSGYRLGMDIFGSKLQIADQTAESLVKEHCNTKAQLAEAAHSLIVLGVPAKSVIKRAATETPDGFFSSALGLLGGSDSIDTLCQIVADPRTNDDARKKAAMSLEIKGNARTGAALLAGLKLTQNEEVKGTIAKALAHARYKPAGPALLDVFRSIKNDYFRLELAQALAAVGYTEAIPELKAFEQRLFKDSPVQAVSGIKMSSISEMPGASPAQGATLALIRLTGDWGKPGRSMRIHLVPPEMAVVGNSMPLTIYIENIGQQPFQSWNSPDDTGLFIDGKPRYEVPLGYEGLTYPVLPGGVHAIYYDLGKDIQSPGSHTVRYVVGDAESNLASLVVRSHESSLEEVYTKQLDQINILIKSNSKDAKVYAKRARIYAAMKKFQKAADDYNTAISLTNNLDPSRVTWLKELSAVHELLNKHDRALSDMSLADENEYEIKRQASLRKKLDSCNQVIEHPRHDNPEWLARQYMNRAHLYYQLGNFEMALADCNKALALGPGCVNFPLTRGQVYNALGQYDKAIADFSRVTYSMPEAYSNRGYSYLMLKQYKQALDDCNRAFEESRRFGQAAYYSLGMYDYRGQVYLALAQYDKALADFSAALALERPHFIGKEDIELHRAKIQYLRGVAYEKSGNHKLAAQDKEVALANGYAPQKKLGIGFCWVNN